MKVKTHKFIINKSIDKLDIELFKKHRKYLLKGARKADYSLAHLSFGTFTHYYNPDKQRGWILLRNAKGQSSRFFEKAVSSYKQGKTKKSMIQLGIALHLIADAATPSHSKVKAHFPFLVKDSFEGFINKNLIIAELCLENIKINVKNSIEDYFDELSRLSAEYRLKRIGLLAFVLGIFRKKIKREELVNQTKELVPLSISSTMGAIQIFYNRINSKN